MEKSKYIKPQCEDIFLARGSGVDENCVPGSVATGNPGCVGGSGAADNCIKGNLAVMYEPCSTGQGQQECITGRLAVDCSLGDQV